MPAEFHENQDRYVIEYELRHTFKTQTIGELMKIVVRMDSQELPQS